jgi:hypothetical protein
LKRAFLACGIALALIPTAPAAAESGGTAVPTAPPPGTTISPAVPTTVPGTKARLVHGVAIAPASAPPAVQSVIAAANQIVTRPYVWGGGHGAWVSSGYDCSGAVSYALHGGGFLDSPMDSTGLERWGVPGRGGWISVYANGGHAYAVIAGLRWDTSGNRRGISGPRWHKSRKAPGGGRFVARHAPGY